jgi:hypothetical protein
VEATPQRSVLSDIGDTTSLRLQIRPSLALIDTTVDAVESFLNDCVAQAVLQPVGCPFGVSIDDRVIGTPQWQILDYPVVELTLGADRAAWSMSAQGGVAEVTIEVQSLFDGTLSTSVETLDFDVYGIVRGTTVDEPVLNLF